MTKKLSRYEQILKNAQHHRAIGNKHFYLQENDNKPWNLVTSFEYDEYVPTTLYFTAKDAKNKFEFSWQYSLTSSSGSRSIEESLVDIDRAEEIAKLLPKKLLPVFKKYLLDRKHKYQEIYRELELETETLFETAESIHHLVSKL